MTPTILLDMDGVLADFFTGVFDIHGLSLEQLTQEPQPWNYAIEEWIAKLKGNNYDTDDLWHDIDSRPGFWSNLPMYPWTQELVDMCLDFSSGKTYISTSPGLAPQCYSEKVIWLRKNIPQLPKDHIMMGRHKHLMANRSHVLIDDHSNNIGSFLNGGGLAIMFPQPWNDMHIFSKWKLQTVRQQLVSICRPNEKSQKD